MNEYRNRNTGAILTETQLRAAVNIMLPAVLDQVTLDALDIDPVLPSPAPDLEPGQTALRNGAVLVSGKWFYSWTVDSISAAELARIRADEIAVNNAPILAALEAIDARSIRPLRAGDQEKLDELEAEAVLLRNQLLKA